MKTGKGLGFGFSVLRSLSLLLCAVCTTAVAGPVEKLRITNGEWPPYLSRDLQHYGLATRIVTEAFAQEGIQVEYAFFPWNRAFQLAQSGRWDGTAIWLQSPEREADFYLSDPVIDSTFVFFHRKDFAFDWKTVDDLHGLRIGGTLEYNYGEKFEAAEKAGALQVERVSSDEQNFSRLLANRIQVFPMERDVGLEMLRKKFSAADRNRITWHKLPVRHDPLHLLLTRKNPLNALNIVRFNRGLKQLRDSGRIQQYLEESRQGRYQKKPHEK